MKRILFVDDEVGLLDGLRARLRPMRGRWEMVFVESASRALTEFEHREFDIIVSDVRMPVMDGVQLLTQVASRWPQTVRIMLSGYSEEEKTARLLTVAHQYLSKPCDVSELENAVERCFQLHDLLFDPRLRALVGRVKQLPALPRVYSQLCTAMSQDQISVQGVARIISADPVIAARVLQVVNSAFFRAARHITRIEQAITYLGFAAVRNVVMSVEVFSQWPESPSWPAQFAPVNLQQRAQNVAAVAHSLAGNLPLADDAMLAGLLHNIGYWILLQECPEELRCSVDMATRQSISQADAERHVLGASHAQLGAYLLGLWGLPQAVVEAIAFQHAPEQIARTQFDVLAALVIAKSLSPIDTHTQSPPRPATPEEILQGDVYLRSLRAPFDWTEAQRRASRAFGDMHP